MPEAKSNREPRALSTEYHKARKQLMFWAAILFIWALVGIDLDKAKDAEGYAGALVKSIKSPQAVPWVLLALVVYFVFKCSIEWGQCPLDRRRVNLARIDFISALSVSGAAIVLYLGQTFSQVQFADLVQSNSLVFLSLADGLVAGVLLVILAINLLRSPDTPSRFARLFVLSALTALPLLMAFHIDIRWPFVTLGIVSGLAAAILILVLAKQRQRRALPKN